MNVVIKVDSEKASKKQIEECRCQLIRHNLPLTFEGLFNLRARQIVVAIREMATQKTNKLKNTK